MRGGKRLRACLLWWGWRAVGGADRGPQVRAVLSAAGALELLQTCALVHDDIMDESPLRRGRPAVHMRYAREHERCGLSGDAGRYGRSMAILAGDLALAWADDLFEQAAWDEATGRRVRPIWRAMRTEMVAGQHLDLYAQAAGDRMAATALRIAYLKSALYSVERPLQLGAAAATAETSRITALRAVGRPAGLAFQLRDDLSDVFGDPADTGKPTGSDVREGKSSYLISLALIAADRRADQDAARLLRASLGDGALPEERLEHLREVLVGLGVRAAVERRIERLTGVALGRLAQADFEPVAERRLRALLSRVAGLEAAAGQGASGRAAGTDAQTGSR
jgi:geranylgeranyl diphosphate synthase type I